ncbi:MAG TPA: hypothetical protein VF204_22660 [Streptosporangiaceae bacterium]
MRLHPAVFFPPLVVLMSAAVAYLLLVSIQFLPGPHPQAAGRGPGRPVPQRILPATGSHHGGAPARPPAASVPAGPPPAAPSPSPTRVPSPSVTDADAHRVVLALTSPAPTSPSPSPSSPQPPARRSPLPTKSASAPPVPPPGGQVAPGSCVRLDQTRVCLAAL